MAKKPKDQVPNPNSVVNRDILQRLNFMYQASTYLNTLPKPPDTKRKNKRRITADQLSRNYVSAMKAVGQKTTVKIDPTVKRTLCQGCDTILIAGSSATVRIKKSPTHGHLMIYHCINCKQTRRIPAPALLDEKNHTPLSLRPDAGHVIFCGQEKLIEDDP